MATFMKSLFWSITAGLTLFIFLPEAEGRGKMGFTLMGRKQMPVNSNKMVGMLNGGTTIANTKMRPTTSGGTTTGNRMMGGMMNGGMTIGNTTMGRLQTMTNSNMMGRMMNGNMGGMMNGGMMTGNTMGGMTTGTMTGSTMNHNMMGTPFFPNGFGGFGNQGMGFSGNGFSGNGFSGSGFGGIGTGGYGGGYGSGGYGLGGFDPNSYAPTDNSQKSNSSSRRRRSRQEEPPTLTPEQERERIHQVELTWSRSPLPDNQTTSATALNILLADLQNLQTRGIQGPEVKIDQAILPSVNVIVDGRNGNIGVLKHDGRIHWPTSLSEADFAAERLTIESSLAKVIDEVVDGQAVDLHDLTGALASTRFRLAAKIEATPAPEYIRAKRLLDQLDDVVRLLRQPDAGNYFNQIYAAKGQTVAQLVQYMSLHGLRFAPAVEGDEPAYVALHQTLAKYDLAANSQVVAKK